VKDTKLPISNKTVTVDLPNEGTSAPGSVAPKTVLYHPDTKQLTLGSAGKDTTPFNGERPITLAVPGLQGKTLHGNTTGEVLTNLLLQFYPTQPPTCTLIASNPQRLHGAAPDVILYYNAYPGDNSLDIINVNGVNIDLDIPQGSQNTATIQDTDTTYSMLVQDDEGLQGLATATVQYFHERYWFTSSTNLLLASAATISAFLQGLASKEFSTARQQSRTFTVAREYIYFAYPSSFGPASFVVGGLPNTAYQLGTFDYTNTNGYVEPYNLYRSGNAGTGTIGVALN
jgi:hypothetical protein